MPSFSAGSKEEMLLKSRSCRKQHQCCLQVDQELQTLMALLPGLELRFERMKADLLIRLLTQQQEVAAALMALRAALPAANIAAIVTQMPSLLADRSIEELQKSIGSIRCALRPRSCCWQHTARVVDCSCC